MRISDWSSDVCSSDLQSQAPDFKRGWGRAPVAGDYYYDNPHLLGTMRTGPDLLNIGARQPSADRNLGTLYQPRAYTPGSQLGRLACRERVCEYVEIWVVAESKKQKQRSKTIKK